MTSSLSSYSLRKTAETMHRRAAARSCSAIRRSPKTRSMTVHDAWSGRCRHIFHVARAEDRTGDDHDAIGMVSAACRGWARHQTVFTRRRWRPCGDRVHTGSSSSSPSPRRRDMARRESGTLCGEASTSRCVRGRDAAGQRRDHASPTTVRAAPHVATSSQSRHAAGTHQTAEH